MPRYALITNGTVENIIIADSAPANGVALNAGQAVNIGDSYANGTFAPRTLTLSEQRATAATARLVQGRAQLRAIRTQAQAAADASTALTLLQLTNQFRTLCGAVATLTQTLMDIELVMAWHQDDGGD